MLRKDDIVKAVAAETGLKQKEAHEAVTAVFNNIISSLAQGDEIVITGFGKFKAIHRDARKVRNPMTQESIQVPAHIRPQFAFAEGVRIAFRDSKQSQYLKK